MTSAQLETIQAASVSSAGRLALDRNRRFQFDSTRHVTQCTVGISSSLRGPSLACGGLLTFLGGPPHSCGWLVESRIGVLCNSKPSVCRTYIIYFGSFYFDRLREVVPTSEVRDRQKSDLSRARALSISLLCLKQQSSLSRLGFVRRKQDMGGSD